MTALVTTSNIRTGVDRTRVWTVYCLLSTKMVVISLIYHNVIVFNNLILKFQGIWAPRDWPGLPPVNEVSRTIADIDFPDHQLTITVMHWGQFVAHDLTHVPTFRARK